MIFLKMGKKGLFWAKSLAEYQRISNEKPKNSTKVQISIYSVFCTCKPGYHINQAFIHLGPLLHLGSNFVTLGTFITFRVGQCQSMAERQSQSFLLAFPSSTGLPLCKQAIAITTCKAGFFSVVFFFCLMFVFHVFIFSGRSDEERPLDRRFGTDN